MKIYTSYADAEKDGYTIVQFALESDEFEMLRKCCEVMDEVHDDVLRKAIILYYGYLMYED